MGLFDGAGGGGLFGRRAAVAPGTDPNAAYQMPQVPWAQNPMITTAALGLLGGRSLNEGLQNVAQNAPAGLAAKTAMQRDMYSLQEKARTDAEAKAEQARLNAAMNAAIKIKSNQPLTAADQAALNAAPEVMLKFGMPAERDPVIPEGSLVWDEKTGTYVPAAGGVKVPKPGDASTFRKEIVARPAYQKVAEADPIYRSMVETYPRKTRASDLNLVYGLAKMLDPNSAVKEGEVITVKDTASLPDWLIGEINRVNGGSALQEPTRQAILLEAKSRMDGYLQNWEREAEYFRGVAGRGGFALEDIPSFAAPPVLPFTGTPNFPDVPPDPDL